MISKTRDQLRWRKSSYSTNGGECVEFATPDTASVAVRDSKSPDGPALRFSNDAWTAFVSEVAVGAFDAS